MDQVEEFTETVIVAGRRYRRSKKPSYSTRMQTGDDVSGTLIGRDLSIRGFANFDMVLSTIIICKRLNDAKRMDAGGDRRLEGALT